VKRSIPYLALRSATYLLHVLPFAASGAISTAMSFVLNHVLRYRRKTALDNLSRSFPEKSLRELKGMMPKVYRNMTDVFVETIWAFKARPSGIRSLLIMPDREDIRKILGDYRGAIIVTGHLSNWEYCGYCLHNFMPGQGIVVYHPLKDKGSDEIIRNFRLRSEMQLVTMRDTIRTLTRKMSELQFVYLIADQSPDPSNAQWETFFGQETAFFRGPGVLAHRYNLPVFFIYPERKKQQLYQIHFESLCPDPGEISPEEITRLYIRRLEAAIRDNPESWLWTHRRWKHKREG
jgi:KDO2-lipid IV(A) lauroyltransferase